MNEFGKCPKCGAELEMEPVKVNDKGGYDFDLGISSYCKQCGYENLEY